MKSCDHLNEVSEVKSAKEYVCEICVVKEDSWVHLRTCQTCGITLCCDSSPNKHATRHFQESGHAVICSAEPGERWLWCYSDNIYLPY